MHRGPLQSKRPGTARAGWSLIELLTAVSILGVFSALTGGAVMKVRSVSTRMEVENWKLSRKFGEVPARTTPVKVLFVGNSYIYYNDLPGAVVALAEARNERPKLIVDQVTVGGATLESLWADGSAAAKVRSTDWDVVVLQERRGRPVDRTGPDGFGGDYGRNTLFVPYARKFNQAIRDRGAITMFLMTWKVPALADTTQDLWTDSIDALAKDLKAEVSPAGRALEMVLRQKPTFPFYADGYPGHPTPVGTYLVACCFYAALYGKDPTGLPPMVRTANGAVVGVPAGDARLVQSAAWDALQETKKRIGLTAR